MSSSASSLSASAAQTGAGDRAPGGLSASLVLAEKAAPRYTSYPTAPHFSADIDAARATQWLGALAPETSLSLYLHVPYCRAICNYCGCNTKAALRDEPLDAYEHLLAKEIALVSSLTPARGATHVHWGGGTPSLLGPRRLADLWRALGEAFDLAALTEHAIELDPRTVDAALAEGLAAIGVNRVSFGVQDMNDHVQRAIGRIQPQEVVERAVALVRAAGIQAVNLDLMYGLPEQSVEDVRRTAELAVALKPDRLAIFGYAHVPWFKVHQRLIDVAALPGAAERLAHAAAARETLEANGFESIGLDHFAHAADPLAIAARAGTMRRNFQGYTTDGAQALIGLGVSSIGALPQGYVQNAPDLGAWKRAIEEGRLAVARGVAFSDDDRLRAAVIERLMCDFEVDYGAVALAMGAGIDALDEAAGELDALQGDGVLRRTGRRVQLTEAGKPFVRLAAATFDAHLKHGAARHSVAV